MLNKGQQLLLTARTAIGYYKYVPLFCIYIVDDPTSRIQAGKSRNALHEPAMCVA